MTVSSIFICISQSVDDGYRRRERRRSLIISYLVPLLPRKNGDVPKVVVARGGRRAEEGLLGMWRAVRHRAITMGMTPLKLMRFMAV